ncbi:hypothetical protein LTR05_004488 [Lithohypha guttulata]|uniref:Uncharacterized protein n=1 Tax=Lithohypha guttulata TaxID=1690604 RepID=A0AAN7SYL9_9EURO|nr:hypothetical protein LTR05_004488 [Lithohypha guttulata]
MDRNFESNMGAGRSQGVADERNDYGLGAGGSQAQDTLSTTLSASERGNTENLGTGRGAQPSDTGDNQFGVGNERRDQAPGFGGGEEGMWKTAGGTGVMGGQADDGHNEYGMGSGRPTSEQGMGIIPGKESEGHGHGGSSGGGLKDKIKGVFSKDKANRES